MKRLILMRHAKSSWSDPDQDDIDRPLNKRGRRDAPAIGRWLREKGYLPQQALVSTSVRTRETWRLLREVLPDCPTDFLASLYDAGAGAMLKALRRAPEGCETLLLISHQPGIGEFAARLLASPFASDDFARYPTAAVAVIDFDVDGWDAVDWRSGDLVDFVIPKTLG